MQVEGNIEDLSVVQVVQYIHASGKSGILHFKRGGGGSQEAHVFFQDGHIVRAAQPGMTNLGDVLCYRAKITPSELHIALRIQESHSEPKPLGLILKEMNAITHETLKEAVIQQIEQVFTGLVGWTKGTFQFEVKDLSNLDDIGAVPMDLLLPEEIKTQFLLLDAAHRLEEGKTNESGDSLLGDDIVEESIGTLEMEENEKQGIPVVYFDNGTQVVSTFLEELAFPAQLQPASEIQDISEMVAERVENGETPAVLLSCPSDYAFDDLKSALVDILEQKKDIPVMLLSPELAREEVLSLYRLGVRFVIRKPWEVKKEDNISPYHHVVKGCIESMLAEKMERTGYGGNNGELGEHFPVIKSMMLGLNRETKRTDITLQFLQILSDHLERVLLFLPRPKELIGLGGMGKTNNGRLLKEESRTFQFSLEAESLPKMQIASRTPFYGVPPKEEWLKALHSKIGAPASGEIVILPVAGVDQVVCLVYGDNGAAQKKKCNLELLEIAARQTGIIIENNFLLQQIQRNKKQA